MSELSIWPRLSLPEAFWFQEGPGVRKWQFTNSGIKLLNVGNIEKNGTLNLAKTDRYLDEDEVAKKYSHFLVDEGDLVIASSGISFDNDGLLRTRGTFINSSHLPLCLNTSTIRFKATEGLSDLRFLRFWLNSYEFRSQITKLVTGTAQQNFGPSHLKAIKITLPPLVEQQQIADILDRTEALLAKRLAILDQLDELVKSVFIEIFGDLVENPKRWDVKKIDNIAEVKTGGTPSRDIKDYWQNGTLPWVKTTEIKENIIYETEECISESGFQNSNATLLPQNSILIAMYGQGKTRGRTAKLGIQATTNQACAAILPSDKYETDFLWTYLRLSYEALRNLGRGGNQPNLNLSMIKDFKVYFPPIENQKRFSEILASMEKIKRSQQQSLLETNNLFDSLMHEAFNGKLFSHQSFEREMGNGGDL